MKTTRLTTAGKLPVESISSVVDYCMNCSDATNHIPLLPFEKDIIVSCKLIFPS